MFSLYRRSLKRGAVFFGRFWSRPLSQRTPAYTYQSVEVAFYIVCTVLVDLGYFLSISKCSLAPVAQIQHVEIIVEFIAQASRIPEDKITIGPL